MATQDDCDFTEEIKEALKNNNLPLAAEKIKKHLDKQNNIPLNIAITGESGSGKSTFVNAFRGIDNKDERAAPTGAVETTSKVTPYPHPNYPNVTLWDLPGIGTTNFPADKYLEHVGFEKFDFFIVISADRFRENDVKLAQEIQKIRKKFYFVRSKIDNNLRDEKRSQGKFNEERTLTQIRDNCIKGLQELGVGTAQVFLVSSFDLHLYDFCLVEETLERELPKHKRNALLFAMPTVSLDFINKKKEALQSEIKWHAILSAVVAAVPIPGLSFCADTSIMAGIAKQYTVAFGLDILSLNKVAQKTGVSLDDLRAVIMSPLAATTITPALILKELQGLHSTNTIMLDDGWFRCIPVVGSLVAVTSIYKALTTFLNILADDAQRVFNRALGLDQ